VNNVFAFLCNHPLSALGVAIYLLGEVASFGMTPSMPKDPGTGFIDPSANARYHETLDKRIAGHRTGTLATCVGLACFALDAFLSFQ
jgi:hypothetical protein